MWDAIFNPFSLVLIIIAIVAIAQSEHQSSVADSAMRNGLQQCVVDTRVLWQKECGK